MRLCFVVAAAAAAVAAVSEAEGGGGFALAVVVAAEATAATTTTIPKVDMPRPPSASHWVHFVFFLLMHLKEWIILVR